MTHESSVVTKNNSAKKNVESKKKKKVQRNDIKVGDIVSCLGIFCKEKRYTYHGASFTRDVEDSDSSEEENTNSKKKKRRTSEIENENIWYDHLFHDEEANRKSIVEDTNILKDKKFEYEDDELDISAEDSILVNGRIYEDVGTMEVHVFNHDEYIFNIYDDVILDNFPICLEPIYKSYYTDKNIVAIGTVDSSIGLWDLSTIHTLEPVNYLGSKHKLNNKKKRQKNEKTRVRMKELQDNGTCTMSGHTKSVTCLHSSKMINSLLCSGSKDRTIKLWDLQTLSHLHTFAFHDKQVKTVDFHLNERSTLVSTSSDKTLKLYDIRSNKVCIDVGLAKIPESSVWDRYNDKVVLISDVKGYISKIDLRKVPLTNGNTEDEFGKHDNESIVRFKAFDNSCVSILSTYYKNFMLAVSEDGVVKAFDWSQLENKKPKCIYSKNMKRKTYSMIECEDWPNVVFFGCDKVYDWDLKSCEDITTHFTI